MKRVDNPGLKRKVLDHLANLYSMKEIREPNHLSTYITCRTKSFLDQKMLTTPNDDEVMLFALGYGLQDVLTPKDASTPVIVVDGITYRPDMILSNRLNEIKTTRKSAKFHYVEDILPSTWLDYMMGGCYMKGSVEYDLIILYMLGNYSPPFPVIYAETIYFDKEELDANWQKIIQQKHILDESLRTGNPPEPFKNCYDWECKYCRYKMICDNIVKVTGQKFNAEQAEEDKKLWD